MATVKCQKYDNEVAEKNDLRMKVTNEIFENIKILKMNAWEDFFHKRLTKIRQDELNSLKKSFLSEVFISSSLWLTSTFIIIAIFGSYMYFGGEITPINAFAIMATFYAIQNPLREFPVFLIKNGEYKNSAARIEKFLLAEDQSL